MPIASVFHANADLARTYGNPAAYATFLVGLLTVMPTGAISTAVECVDANYVRQSLGNTSTQWNAPAGARVNTKVSVVFPVPATSVDFVVGFFLMDPTGTGALNDRSIIHIDRLATPRQATPLSPLFFAVGDLAIVRKVGY